MFGTQVVCQYCETVWNSEVLVCPSCNEYKGLVQFKAPSCEHCGTTEMIVHSGTDAFMLGVLDKVERICYGCAQTERNN
jgi:hypothetical protein